MVNPGGIIVVSGLTRRVRDLEDTLAADAEFKRSLQANIEELYKERKAAKAVAEEQITNLQAEVARLQASSPSSSSTPSAETEALINEKTHALTAARAEVCLFCGGGDGGGFFGRITFFFFFKGRCSV